MERSIEMLKMRLGTLFLAGVMAMAVTSGTPARAQEGSGDVNNKKVSLNLENADIRYALKLLFQSVGVNYVLDQNVQGTVTVSLTDVSFRTALESILRGTASQTPLTYRAEGGVYQIAPKVELPPTDTTVDAGEEPARPSTRPVKIQVNYADAIDLALAFGGGVLESRFAQMGMGGMGGGFGGGMGGGGMGGMGGGMGGGGFGGGGMGGGGFGGGGMGGFGGGGMGGGGFGGGGMGGGGLGGGGFGGGGFGGRR
jgi:hypothetical protein